MMVRRLWVWRARHNASTRFRSSCSKALAIRLISEDRAPVTLAVSCHFAVTVGTSP
jgi:hypothetical protein